MRIINPDLRQLKRLIQDIGADKEGCAIMAPKGIFCIIKLEKVPAFCANILKQEMLSKGGEVCVSRDALRSAKTNFTDCLLMGTIAQLRRLSFGLRQQPEPLRRLNQEIVLGLKNYNRQRCSRVRIMGVANLTPDSFSGDGLYRQSPIANRQSQIDNIIKHVENMVKDGADIIDVGGESSRPGAEPVSAKEELNRVIPIIKRLAKRIKVPISIDTYKPEVARASLDCGASIVNDITGLRNTRMIKEVVRAKARVVIMHMKGSPKTMQINPHYESLIDEIILYLEERIKKAVDFGIDKKSIIIDPGIGFGKRKEDNLRLLASLGQFRVLGCPILVGPSRKTFIGEILNRNEPSQRLNGTLASVVIAAMNGADIVRVHDVKSTSEALKIADAVNWEQRSVELKAKSAKLKCKT
ncbi:MAG: dihydropteroate synthase [Candidatus Omnitrophica bacterium]|nr:dihydropteroate synthase [Candidatus Omnitrophota bacterium]